MCSKDDIVFTCAVDAKPKYIEQATRLLLSLRWFGGSLASARFVVGAIGDLPKCAVSIFRKFNADILDVERFDTEHGPSNKISLFSHEAFKSAEHLILLDCDTVVLRDPSAWLRPHGFAAKPADLPTVSTDELAVIFAHYGVAMPDRRYEHDVTGDACITYVNAGALFVSKEWRTPLADAWKYFGRRVIDDHDQLPGPFFHSDQTSLALALAETETPFTALPSAMNMGVHLEGARYPDHFFDVDPIIVHYHHLSDTNGYLSNTPFPLVNRRLDTFNTRLRAEKAAIVLDSPNLQRSRSTAEKVVVGSGWWSDFRSHEWAIGNDFCRSAQFFDIWYRQVMKCLAPTEILVTDSSAPVKPDYRLYENVQWVELDANYGQANDIRVGKIKAKYCGFTRSVLQGAMFALCCDADWYVYVEQDCLLRGSRLLEYAIGESDSDIFIGMPAQNAIGLQGKPAATMYQQSFMVVRRSGLERFIEGLLSAPWTDGEVSPEETMRRQLDPLGTVRIPYGRSRPIDFEQTHFYVQHLSREELDRFCDVEEVSIDQQGSVYSWMCWEQFA